MELEEVESGFAEKKLQIWVLLLSSQFLILARCGDIEAED